LTVTRWRGGLRISGVSREAMICILARADAAVVAIEVVLDTPTSVITLKAADLLASLEHADKLDYVNRL